MHAKWCIKQQIDAKVEQRLSIVSVVERSITANLSSDERMGQDGNDRAFTGQLVP